MRRAGVLSLVTARLKGSNALDWLDLAIASLFIVVFIGVALASRQWWTEGRGQTLNCVKILSVEWKTSNTRSSRSHLGFLTYQDRNGGVVKTIEPLLFVPSTDDYRAATASGLINATCVDLWIRPGSESTPSFEQIRPPLTRVGSVGQWLLGTLLLLLCGRKLLSSKVSHG